MVEQADLEGLLASAAGYASGLGKGVGAAAADSEEGFESSAESLLAVNISTASSVDADNLQKVLTFLVSSVQSIAASCASSEACHAATEEKLAAATGELTSLRAKFDALSSQVDGLANDSSAAEDTASMQAALTASEERTSAQLQDLETRLSAEAQTSHGELEAALASVAAAANEKLSATQSALDEQSKESAAATASVTERLAATETETAGRLGELQALVDSARTDLQSDIRDLREFVKTGLQAAAEGKQVPTEMPDPDALAAEAAMKDQLAAATAECAMLKEQIAALHTKQDSLEQGLDPLPASVKELAQIVGSITANTDRAERRSILLQEQVEDLHARWNDAGQVIDEAYSRPGSAFSRPGSALDSDGAVSGTHSRPGTRELAFPEAPGGDSTALEFSARPRSVQRPQSQHSVAPVEEAIEEEEEDVSSPTVSRQNVATGSVTNSTNATAASHGTSGTNGTELQEAQEAALSATVPDVSQMSPVEQIVVAEIRTEMEAEIVAGATVQHPSAPVTSDLGSAATTDGPAPTGSSSEPSSSSSIAAQGRVAPVTRMVVAAAKAAEESTGTQVEYSASGSSAAGKHRRRHHAPQQADPRRDLASIGLQRLMAEVETQAVRLAELEASMKEFSEMPPPSAAVAHVPAPPAPAPAPSPPPAVQSPPPDSEMLATIRPVTPTRPATPTGTEMMAAVQAQIAASEERIKATEQEHRNNVNLEIARLEAELAATKKLREEVAEQQAGLQDAKDADARLATQMAALEQQFQNLPAPVAVSAPAPAPTPAPVAPGVDPAVLEQMSDALRTSMAQQTAELGKSLQNQMFEEVDVLKNRLEEVSSSIPGQVEAVADSLEDIRKALGTKADTGAIRQLEGIIGQLQAMTEKKQLPGSNSPPMSPAPPPRRYQVPPTITARIISPDLNDIRDALGAIRSGLSAKADTDKMDKLMKSLGPRMKELGMKLKEVDTLSTSLRRASGAGLLEGGASGLGVETHGRRQPIDAVDEVVKKVKKEHPDRSETVALSNEISSKHSTKVVNAFRQELGAHEERLFNGLCGTFRQYAVGLGQIMREELSTLRLQKADRVDIKRLEHILNLRIADLSSNVEGGGPARRASTGAVFPSMLAMDIRGGSASESLEDMQARLEESLAMLRKMYEKEGWGVRSLSPTKSAANAGSGEGRNSLGATSSTNVSFTQFELPSASSSGTHTAGPAGLPRPRSTPLSRLGQFDDGRHRTVSRGAPGGADLGLSTSSFGGGGSSIGALEEAGGEARRSSRGLRSRPARPGSRGAPARLQPLQR